MRLEETVWRISQKVVLVHVQLRSRFRFEAIVPIRGGWPHPYRFERNPIPWSWGPIMALSVGKNVIDSVPGWQGGYSNVLKLTDLQEPFP